jgi:hypothetical protein
VPSSLRRVVDAVGIIAGIGVLTIVGVFGVQHYQREQHITAVGRSLHEFERILSLQAAAKQVELSPHGWPLTMDAGWFRSAPPANALLSSDRPWVEIATQREGELTDPPVRVAAQRSTAAFWYNPYRGLIRARVPLLASEQRTIDLYNRVNGSAVSAGFEPLAEEAPKVEAATPPPPKEPALPKIRVTGAGTNAEEDPKP